MPNNIKPNQLYRIRRFLAIAKVVLGLVLLVLKILWQLIELLK